MKKRWWMNWTDENGVGGLRDESMAIASAGNNSCVCSARDGGVCRNLEEIELV